MKREVLPWSPLTALPGMGGDTEGGCVKLGATAYLFPLFNRNCT